MTGSAKWVVAAALAALAACKPAVDVANPSPFDEDDPAAFEASEEARARREMGADAEPKPPVTQPAARRKPASGRVDRGQLIAVLDAGIGPLLSGIEVNPRLDLRNRFIGWEVVRFSYTWADIRPGDVISGINGRPIGKPHELQELWDSLRTAPSIVVRGQRDGAALELRFDVLGDAPAAAAP